MKPAPFQYHRAMSEAEAVAIMEHLGEEGRILAGGQSLVPLMNFRLAQPEHLVDINAIAALDYVRRENGAVAVGATARQSAVEHADDIRMHVPLVAEALESVAHPPIRHRGTVVGSIAHADPAAELPSVALATRADIVLTSAAGKRTVAADDFFLGPFETVLEPGELVTEVRFPIAAPGSGQAFAEFARRHGDFAIAGAAASVTLDGTRVTDASIALCALGPRPMRAADAEQSLIGNELSDELIAQAADRAVTGLEPGADIHGGTEYRIRVARAQVKRALSTAVERARGGGQA
ncbi:FAD binding domain-containing protein [Capillimicrobium parvum]|uniref:6-hydroxypseudooxynicotine dehydrogenase complex subunit alpha n=1 Tax=Capillimicrobium parvum TaxID=2884022 RepID=A0A9E6Y5F1_9ACTN|nr:xanthine dehydrogenase family protein subunit M [Capillimicrobium parvum]UGS38991.1 6-hydroxypseudooxynicotine dehydrogenase complex subunit alpha [Capillimicrobium parvum]